MSPLTNRDTNVSAGEAHQNVGAQQQYTPAGDENKPQPSQSKSLLEKSFGRSNDKKQGPTYVSPSDAIQSPATQKLAGMKQRQMSRQSKNPAARTLFSRTASSCTTDSETPSEGQ